MLIKRNLNIHLLYRKGECDSERLKSRSKKKSLEKNIRGKNEPNELSEVLALFHMLCCVQLFATLWTVGYGPQAPLTMGFSKQE